MTFVALLMRPWVITMRGITAVKAYILADDLLIVAGGTDMIVTTGHDMTVAVWTLDGKKIGIFGQWTLWDIKVA